MTWNYRVVRTVQDGEEWFTIREAFYHKAKDKKPHSISRASSGPGSDTAAGMKVVLRRMMEACDKPVLEDGEF